MKIEIDIMVGDEDKLPEILMFIQQKVTERENRKEGKWTNMVDNSTFEGANISIDIYNQPNKNSHNTAYEVVPKN